MHGMLSAKDPWNRKQDGPPNIDELLGKFFNDAMGGGRGSGSGESIASAWLVPIIFAGLFVLWGLMGFYVIRPAEEGVLLRFGAFQKVVQPGLHWRMPGIESLRVVNTSSVEPYEYSSRMLTEDENYAQASLIVYYRINDPQAFLFQMNDPRRALEKVVASSLRQVVGHTKLEGLLTTEKENVRLEAEKQIRFLMKQYHSGLEITDVKLQEVTVPRVVIEYFDDVIKAREEKAKKISEGERYVKEIIPRARGQAERLLRAAQAYKEKVVLDARAGVAKFEAVLPQFVKHPDLTRSRLYFESMRALLPGLNKVYVNDSKQLFYLPLPNSAGEKNIPVYAETARP